MTGGPRGAPAYQGASGYPINSPWFAFDPPSLAKQAAAEDWPP